MTVTKTQASELLGIHPTSFAKSVKSKWLKAVTSDGKVDMDVAYAIQKQCQEQKEYQENLKAFSIFLKQEYGVAFKKQSEITGINLFGFYSFSYNAKRLEPLIKFYPKAWEEFNQN